jgi:hypothetical protein
MIPPFRRRTFFLGTARTTPFLLVTSRGEKAVDIRFAEQASTDRKACVARATDEVFESNPLGDGAGPSNARTWVELYVDADVWHTHVGVATGW